MFDQAARRDRTRDKTYCSRRCGALLKFVRPKLRVLAATDAAYIAGMIDGEGSIGLRWYPRAARPYARVAISNTHLATLLWIRRTTGVGSLAFARRNEREGHRRCYEWVCNGQNAVALLRACGPYLRIKRTRAREAIRTQSRAVVLKNARALVAAAPDRRSAQAVGRSAPRRP